MEALPVKLSNAIDRELAPLHPDKLRNACFELSQRYAQGQHIESQLHRHAYIAARLPATYGATRDVFRRIEPFLKSTKSLLDLGAGVGSLAWAAKEVMPRLKRVTLFEKDIELLRLGQHLTQNNLDPLQLAWCRDNIAKGGIFPTHDVVVISYALNELTQKEQIYALERAYAATDELLILIEPGTPAGFGRILEARTLLLHLGAQIIAPCPQNNPCPLEPAFKEAKDWCHFSVRIPRGKYHRRAKEGALPYEDEKYIYLVASPHIHPVPENRIIKAPIRKTGHVILDLCTQKGQVERRVISKTDGNTYTKARDAEWGEEWEE
ncbi:MAG: small ribosomal subunit Rsm22 family protein [Alphaproteobacteria bacterium]|nr:small ribosomal subunit Rsm22 family protein [Alphaproteobacteria bacterium]